MTATLPATSVQMAEELGDIGPGPGTDKPASGDRVGAEPVLYHEEGPVAYITLNRPDKLNALNVEVFTRIDSSVAQFSRSGSAKVAILHGNGRAFAAGADIAGFVGISPVDYAAFIHFVNGVQQRLVECPKPVIAAVHGYALGGGLELALCCDLIVVAPDAQLGFPEIRLGLLPGAGGTQRLPRLVGLMRATEMIMTGKRLSGTEAVACGLGLSSGDHANVLDAAKALATTVEAQPPVALRLAKRLLRDGLDAPLPSGLALEQSVGAVLFGTADAHEGVTAFLEKRRPLFKGM